MSSSELSLEAPLAFSEEWPEFGDYQTSCEKRNPNQNESECILDNNFKDVISSSLEDLVNTFDEKITNCFRDYNEEVEKLAPVQVRAQEDVINESQMWWTLTGNFGNILPIDWSQTYARKLQLPALNLNELSDSPDSDVSLDEEELAKDLDLHSLILSSIHQEPIFTAEQVLEEIDEIMQKTSPDSDISDKPKPMLRSLMYQEKLATLSISQLNELYMELERMIQDHSETLIQELALRDELEFEKELKNTFISLLLGIQNKRRQHNMERKKGKSNEPKYLTTVIPYDATGPPDIRTIQILIKILKAVNDDSPTVPTLLTDFILKVLCPT